MLDQPPNGPVSHAAPRPAPRAAPALRPSAEQRLAPPQPKPHHGRYAAIWGVIGVAAISYAGVLLAPGWRSSSDGELANAAPAGSVAALERTLSDVAQLKRQVGTLETDVASVKAQAANHDAREKMLSERVTAVESRVEGFSTQLMQVMADAGRKPGQAVASAPAPQPIAPSRVVNAPPEPKPQTARIETSAIATPPRPAPATAGWSATTAPGAEQPTVTSAPSGVLLASGPSLDALRLSWSLLNDRHKSTLRTLEPRVVSTEPGRYQLIAGPIANEADAAKVCATLRARGVACQPSEFRGDGL